MNQSGYSISNLVQEAQTRWLKPAEVLFILQNYEDHQVTHEPPQKPSSGSLFLFNKRVLRFFRKDGLSWRRKKDGRTVGEAHERLKVGNTEALNCYYAHGEQNSNFQRRSYWILDPAYDHIVLVHYRDITESRSNRASTSQSSPGSSSTLNQSSVSYMTQHPGSTATAGRFYEPYQSLYSPGSAEVSSDAVVQSNGINGLDVRERVGEVNSSSDLEISQALRRLEEQLSLNDDSLKDIGPFYNENENSNDSEYIVRDQSYSGSSGIHDSIDLVQQQYSGDSSEHLQLSEDGFTVESKQTSAWKEMLHSCKDAPVIETLDKDSLLVENGMLIPPSRRIAEEHENSHWTLRENNTQNSSFVLSQEVEDFKFCSYSSGINAYDPSPDCYPTLLDQSHIGMPLGADSSLTTISQKQKFTIREISPEWAYASEATKVIIVGSFLCHPSDCVWTCMFGNIEVPIQIIQEGVLCCQAPSHFPGKVTLCITSGNRESCSEVREFEYRIKPTSSANNDLEDSEATKSLDEMLLLVRFVQMLLSDPLMQKRGSSEMGIDLLGNSKAGEDLWAQVIDALLVGSWTAFSTTDWLLEELLKDKFRLWVLSRSQAGSDQSGCSLSKKEQGIIHMVAGLGFEWALNPILNSGVSINFRDINGWTALHWAARFGREKMTAALLASGASAGAVTDPNPQDPTGKTAGSIAAMSGHVGLAGYLSEVALTSHLLSLTMEESELSRGSADVEAERTVNIISNSSLPANEDQDSLKDTLAAVRNAAQAAARIQSAFRAHSFRKRQQNEVHVATATGDEYSILSNDSRGLSAASKLAFRNARDFNAAALSIQKKYRCWKGRRDFLAFRQKVVKIQAHVRGHQVRKNYNVCWAVGIFEKVVLRWRRRGVGLRGFRNESESIDKNEDEDILKVFRKKKVDAAVSEAVSRVLSMVDSQEARLQYHRMLERYREAKARLESTGSEVASTSQGGICDMENDLIDQFT